jgi:hypothetical protein
MKHNFTHPRTIYFLIGFTFFVLLLWLHLSCARIDGGTTHKVEGEATVRVAFDFSVCDGLPEDARQECIMVLLDLIKKQESAS